MLPLPAYKFIFDQLPGLYLLLHPDFTIADLSESYASATLTIKQEIIGRHMFEVFPDNPDDAMADGVYNLRGSLEYVLQHKKPHVMADQKYDIRRPDGSFEVRYWSPVNTPIFNEKEELIYILHQAEDVSHRKKSEEKFHSLFEASADATIFVNEKGVIHMANEKAGRLLGYDRNDLLGQSVEVLIPASIRQQHVQQRTDFSKAETIRPMHTREGLTAIKKDGTIFPADISLSPIHTDEGIFIAASIRDISQRKKTQEQLELLSQQVNEANDAIYTVNNCRKITSWNQGAELLFGFTAKEAIGHDPVALLQTKNGDTVLKDALETVYRENYWAGELIRKRKDGTYIYVHTSISAVRNKDKQITGYISVGLDISKQKKLQEEVNHLANIVEQTSDAIISRDNNRMLISWNAGAEKLFGYTRAEAIGKTALQLGIVRLTGAEVNEMDNDLQQKGSWTSEKEYFHKDGHSFFGTVTATTVKNDQGDTTATVYIIKDISLHRQLEMQLKRSNEELEEKVRIRTDEIARSEIKYRHLFKNNPMPMWVMEVKTFKILDVNEMAIAHYGYSRLEFLSMTAVDLRPDYSKEVFLNAAHPVAITDNNYNKGTWEHKKKDGTIIQVEIIVHDIIFEGIPARIILANDITQKKKAEEKLKASENLFRALIENTNDIITLMNENFELIYRSPSAARITGWTNEDMIGVNATRNIHPDDKPGLSTVIKEIMLNPGKNIYYKFRMKHKQGHYLWIEGVYINMLQDKYVKAILFNFRDITERKNAEQKIITSEANLKAIFNSTAEGFILTDTNGLVKTFNHKVFEEILLSEDNHIETGKSIYDVIQPGRKKYIQAVLAKVLSGETIHYQRSFTFPGKSTIWIDFVYTPVIENELINGICISGRDITHEKAAEQQIEFDRNNLDALINNTSDVIWSVDRNFNLITFNQAFSKKMEGLYGKVPQAGSNIFKPLKKKKERLQFEATYTRAFNGETFSEIVHHQSPDDSWLEISFNPIYEAEKVVGTACFSRDITERKKAEEELGKTLLEKQALAIRMSAILNTLPANIALLDEKGNIIEVNDAWRNFAKENGFRRENFGVGCNYINCSRCKENNPDSDGSRVAAGITDVLENTTNEFVYEYPCHSPHEERWYRMIVTPLREKDYAGAVVMHIDISELRRLESARLKSSEDEHKKITLAILQGQEKERNYIGRELHDNVNQILAGTKLFLSSSAKKNEVVKDAVQYPIELLSSAIEEIRSLCRNLVSPLKNINLEELAKGLLNNCRQNIKSSFSYSVPAKLLADELKLNIYRILQELISNTLKYAAATSLKISIKVHQHLLTVIVTDDGQGFDVNTKRTGIGISNLINRVESFNGQLKIDSSPGNGCSTTITIPC